MTIILHRNFKKQYKKLNGERRRFRERINLFLKNPFHPLLNNHSLHGEYRSYRSINAGGDLRVIYQEIDSHTVHFIIDTHSNLYEWSINANHILILRNKKIFHKKIGIKWLEIELFFIIPFYYPGWSYLFFKILLYAFLSYRKTLRTNNFYLLKRTLSVSKLLNHNEARNNGAQEKSCAFYICLTWNILLVFNCHSRSNNGQRLYPHYPQAAHFMRRSNEKTRDCWYW